MDQARIIHLLEQELEGSLSAGEVVELDQLKSQEQNEALVQEIAKLIERYAHQPVMIDAATEDEGFRIIMSVDEAQEEQVKLIPQTHRIHFLRTAWFRYAAAILIVFSLAYLYISNQKEKPSVTKTNPVPVQNDVAPGGNRATLTLADGSKIVLDSAGNGVIAQEGKSAIEKRGTEVVYHSDKEYKFPSLREGSGVGLKSLVYNTMATPRGGQYQLILPDGTKVWLNAESSITYPTAFTEKQRRVTITGEAYFEVAKNKAKPFIVSVIKNDDQSTQPSLRGKNIPSLREGQGVGSKSLDIEVLGTHFNINAYIEEPTINTTLLEGSVKLTSHFSPLTSVLTSLTLTPGQQGQLTDRKLSLASNPDMYQVMAWKNGIFSFENTSLKTALREIARWYDVEVVYSDGAPEMTLGGAMGRDLNLSEVLKVLQGFGVKTKLENKKLYISK